MLLALLPLAGWADDDPNSSSASDVAPATATAPTAKTDLVYTGSGQQLVNAGTAASGTLYYAAVEAGADAPTSSAYASTVPTETDAGSYDVYYIESAGAPTQETDLSGASKLTATIAAKQIVYYLTGNTYNVGDVIDVTNHYSLAGGYDFVTKNEVKEKLADYAEFKFYTTGSQNVIPVDANGCLTTKGTFPVSALRVVWKDNVKHNYDFRFTSSAEIVVAAMSIANFYAVTTESFTYDGNPKTLANEPKLFRTQADAEDPSKALVKGTDYTVEYRKNTNAGQAEFVFIATQSGNYDEEKIVYFTINKADIRATDFTAPTAIAGLSYNATAKTLIKAGQIPEALGTFQYKLGGGSYSTDLPTATTAGDYVVTWKIKGSANYNDYQVEVTPATNPVTYTSEWTIENVKIAKAMLVIQPKAAKNVLYTGAEPNLSDVELVYTRFYGNDSKALFQDGDITVKVADAIATAGYAKADYDEGLEVVVGANVELENYEIYPVNGALNIKAPLVKVELVNWTKTNKFGESVPGPWNLLTSDKAKLHVLVQTGFDADGNATWPEVTDQYNWPDATEYLATMGTGANKTFKDLQITRESGTSVKKYALTLSGVTTNSNYKLADEDAMTVDATSSYYEITATAIVVKAGNRSKVYGDTTDPQFAISVTGGTLTTQQQNFIKDHMQRVGAGTEEGENVGVYEINFKKDVAEGKDGPEIEGFNITYQVGALAITPATLTITADDQTLYTGNTVGKLDTDAYEFDGLVKGDDEPVVELSFAEYVPVYSFTSYMTNDQEQTTLCTGKVKFVSVDTQNNKTTVEVIENTTQNANVSEDDAAAFVGNQYIVEGTDLTNGTTFQLLTTENAPTGLSVKNVALVPAESGVKVDADGKLVKVNDDPYVTIEGGIKVTVTNAADYAQNYELVVVNGNLKIVNVETTIILSKVNDNTDAIAAANNKLVNVMFEPTENTIIKKEKWYTMVLPFATSVKEISEKFGYAVVDTLNEANNTKNIQLRLHMQDLPANKPFIFKVYKDKNLRDVSFEGKKIIYAENLAADGVCGKDLFGNKFIGTYASKTGFTANQWRMSTSAELDENGNYKYDKWYYGSATNKSTIAPLAAYIESVNAGGDATFNAPIFEIEDLGGNVTIIEGVNLDDVSARNAEGWYTISGIKLDAAPTEKGVYINNGKKVVLK